MHPNVERMLTALTLTSVTSPTDADEFVAPSIKMPHNRVYGGQVMAQALLAATATIDGELK